MAYVCKGKYFEEFEVGEELHSAYRTITETDIVNFAGLSGDYNQLHTDDEFAKTTIHGCKIAHGALTFSITTGLFNSAGFMDGTSVAFLGLQYDYKKAVKPGDTIHVLITVLSKRLTSKGDKGIVEFSVKTINQRDEVVIDGTWKLMVSCR